MEVRMPRKVSPSLTAVELAFMEALWSGGELSPEDMREWHAVHRKELTGGTVRKTLLILMKKGYVERRKDGKRYLYRASVGNDAAKKSMVGELLDRAFGGSASLMVAALLDRENVPADDIARIERIIAERKNGGAK
jgi:BlaI family transcriptional regulator, penicillinase repressor